MVEGWSGGDPGTDCGQEEAGLELPLGFRKIVGTDAREFERHVIQLEGREKQFQNRDFKRKI